VRDATKTIAQIDDAEELARSPIARAIVWTRFSPGFESKSARHVRQSLEAQGAMIFQSILMERAAFREIHITGLVPRQVDATSGPALNISAITAEVLDRLKRIAEAA
jgi:chromosome partitioning protein